MGASVVHKGAYRRLPWCGPIAVFAGSGIDQWATSAVEPQVGRGAPAGAPAGTGRSREKQETGHNRRAGVGRLPEGPVPEALFTLP
ncbi:hypothetical protein GCM10009605_37060 [Nocardiopsis composta]